MGSSFRHERSQRTTRVHLCQWPGCNEKIPQPMLWCNQHWRKIPKDLRDRLWTAKMPGEKVDEHQSEEYLAAEKLIQEWIKNRENDQ